MRIESENGARRSAEGKTHRRMQAEVMDRVQHRGSTPGNGA